MKNSRRGQTPDCEVRRKLRIYGSSDQLSVRKSEQVEELFMRQTRGKTKRKEDGLTPKKNKKTD